MKKIDMKKILVLSAFCSFLIAFIGTASADNVHKCTDCIENAQVSDVVSPNTPYLQINKTNVSTTIIEVGGQIRWRLSFSNYGGWYAYNVKINDELPAGLQYTDMSQIVYGNNLLVNGGQYHFDVGNDGRSLQWTFDVLNPGAAGYLEFNTTATGTINCGDNNATINGTYQPGRQCDNGVCVYYWIGSNGEPDAASRNGNQTTSYNKTIPNSCITITPTTTINVTKVASSPKSYEVCENMSYTITVTQTGSNNLPVDIFDLFPSTCYFNNNTAVNYSRIVLASGNNISTITGNFNGSPDGTASYTCTNTVNVNGTIPVSPYNRVTATTTETVTIKYPVLSITKEVLSSSSNKTQYKITVANSGTGIARNILLNDTMSYDPSNNGWKINGSSIIFTNCLNNSNLAPCNNDSCWGADRNRNTSANTYNNFNFTVNGSTTCTITYWTYELSAGSNVYNTRANTVCITNATDNCTRQLSAKTGLGACATSIVVAPPEHNLIRVNKTANVTTVQAGDIINYTIKVTNYGSVSLKELKFSYDTLPQGFSYNNTQNCTGTAGANALNGYDMHGDGGTTPGSSGIIDDTGAGRLVPGETITCWYTVRANCDALEGAHVNIVKVDGVVTGTGNNVFGEDLATVYVAKPKLIIEKYMSTTTISPGQSAIAQVIVTNIGSGTAYNVNVSDQIIYGGSSVTTTETSDACESGNSLAPGASCTATYTISTAQNTTEPALYEDRANVTYTDKNSGIIGGCDSQTPTVSSDAYLFIISNTNMWVEKDLVNITAANGNLRSNSGPAIRGDTVRFKITVNNTGDPTDNLTITSIYDWMTDANWDNGINCSDDCTNADRNISGGTSYVCNVTCTVNKSAIDGLHCNKVEVRAHSDDNTQFKETDMACFVVGKPVMEFEKVALSETAHPQENVTYKVWVENKGTAVADTYVLEDKLPDSFTYSSSNSSTCYSVTPDYCSNENVTVTGIGTNTPTFTLTSINPSCKCYFIFNALVPENVSEGLYYNTMWGHFNDTNNNTYNNTNQTSGGTYITKDIRLLVNKSVNDTFVQPGDYFNFTIDVRNDGNNTLHNVVVNDAVPSGISIVSNATLATCTSGGSSIICQVNHNTPANGVQDTINCSGDIAKSTTCTINIQAYVNTTGVADKQVPLEGEQCNKVVVSAKVTSDNGADVNLRETDLACFIVGKPHLDIDKWVEGNPTKVQNTNVTYYIEVRNTGTADARYIQIWDSLTPNSAWSSGSGVGSAQNPIEIDCPSGWDIKGYSSGGIESSNPAYFRPSTPNAILGPGQRCLFAYNLTVPNQATGLYENYATVIGQDMDSSILQNATDEAYVMIVKSGPIITKEVNPKVAQPNDTVTITLTVTNLGDAALKNINIDDLLPTGWNFNHTGTISSQVVYDGANNHVGCNGGGTSAGTNVCYNTTTYNATTRENVHCYLPSLCENSRATITFTAYIHDAAKDGSNNNIVNMSAQDNGGNYYYSNSTNVTTIINNPVNDTKKGVRIVKSADKYAVEPGDNITFTLYIMNPSAATLYFSLSQTGIYDVMGKGFDYLDGTSTWNGNTLCNPTQTPDNGDTASQTLFWNMSNSTCGVSTLLPYSVNILTYTARVGCNISTGDNTNYANVTVTTATGETTMNDSTSIEIKSGHSNISITKYASNYKPSFFDYVTYDIVIRHNTSWAHVQGLNITDTIPTGLKYINGSLRIGDIKIYGTYNASNASQQMPLYDCPNVVNYPTGCKQVGTITGGPDTTTTIVLNLTGYVFLSAWEQIKIEYTTQVRPNVGNNPQNNVTMYYLDPAAPEDTSMLSAYAAVLVPPTAGKDSDTRNSGANTNAIVLGDDGVDLIDLNPGWNLISISVMPADKSVGEVLSSISGKYDGVFTYENGWNYTVANNGQWFGSLATIEPGKGYWVHATKATTLKVIGKKVNSMDLHLKEGWNLVGYSVQSSKKLADIPSIYNDIFGYTRGDWTYVTEAYGTTFGDLKSIDKNKGYWINAKQDVNITIGV